MESRGNRRDQTSRYPVSHVAASKKDFLSDVAFRPANSRIYVLLIKSRALEISAIHGVRFNDFCSL